MTMGVRTPLEQEDLWDVSTKDQAARVSGRFEEALEMSHGNIARAAWSVHGRKFVAVGVLKLVHDVVMLSVPFWLQQLLLALEGGASRGVGGWCGGVVCVGGYDMVGMTCLCIVCMVVCCYVVRHASHL